MPCIGHDGIERDLEAFRQLDLLQGLLDRLGVVAALRDRREIGRPGDLEFAQLVQIVVVRSVG